MSQSSSKIVSFPQVSVPDALSEVLRRSARKMLGQVIEQDVAGYVSARHELVGPDGRRLVVRNGHLPGRHVLARSSAVRFAFIRDQSRRFHLGATCRPPDVPASGY